MFVVESVVVLFLFVVHSVDALVRVQQPHAQLEQRTLHKKKKKRKAEKNPNQTQKKSFFFCFFFKKKQKRFFCGTSSKDRASPYGTCTAGGLDVSIGEAIPSQTHTHRKEKKKEGRRHNDVMWTRKRKKKKRKRERVVAVECVCSFSYRPSKVIRARSPKNNKQTKKNFCIFTFSSGEHEWFG